MIINCNKQIFGFYLSCIKEFCPKYAEEVENSQVVDEALYKLGFSNKELCSFNFNISVEEAQNIVNKIQTYHETNYDKFDEYVDFYNLLKYVINENGK